MAASFLNAMFLATEGEVSTSAALEAILKVLLEPNVKQMDKRIFEKSIIHNLEKTSQSNREKMMAVISQFLEHPSFYDTAFLIIACFAVAEISPSPVPFLISSFYQKILFSLPVSLNNANFLNEMIKMWIVVVDKAKQDDEMKPHIASMTKSPTCALIGQIYDLEAS